MRQIDFLDSEIAQVRQLIAAEALSWPEIKRLMTVPGVNVIVAATFMAAVGDIRRFPDRRAAKVRLAPSSVSAGAVPGARRRASHRARRLLGTRRGELRL